MQVVLCLIELNPMMKMLPKNQNKEEEKIKPYINKDGNPSTKSTRHVKANVNTQKENENNQNNNNEVEDLMLK